MTAVRTPVARMHVLARASCSALLLTAVLVAPPAALPRFVGWPLPHAVPRWAEVADALGGASVSDAALLDVLACAAWVLWALVVACATAEAVAWARCREAPRLPVAGFLQPAVRELVASAALLVGALRAVAPAAAAVDMPPLVSVTAPLPPPPAADAAPSTPAGPACLVAPRDSLWKLAERHLGDGLRWRDIWELNRSATFPDGRRFTDPDLIRPGWVLVMPEDATGLPRDADGAPTAVEGSAPATTDPAARAAPKAIVPPAAAPVPGHAAATPRTSAAAARSPADGVVHSPTTTPTPSPSTRPAPADPAGVRSTPRRSAEPSTHDAAAPAPDDPDHDPAPLLAVSGLAAAAVIATLTRLRNRQQRHRRRGRMIRLPRGGPARTEVHLRRAAVGAPFDLLDLALRALAHCLGRRRPGPCPAISVLSAGPEAVEILLTEAVDAPPGPFEVSAGGRAWTLPSPVQDDDLRPLADVQSAPAPALVTVGAVDERTVLIDLEAGARTMIGGDPEDARALLWSMAVDLATSNRADDIDLVLVGKPPAGLDVLDRVRSFDTVAQVLEAVEADASGTSADLARLRKSSTLDARVADPTLILTPTVVLVADAPGHEELDLLLAAASESHGVAVVVAGGETEAEFDRELCIEEDTLVVKPLGLRLRPAVLPPGVVDDIGQLMRTAANLDPGPKLKSDLAPACDRPVDGLTVGPHGLPLAFDDAGQPVLPPAHILVRVMGPVEIVGSERPIDRRRSVELIVYLAFHPEGVDEGRIKAALWPEGAPTRGAFNETVSRARRMLGLDPTGEHHLRPVDNRRYRLGLFVETDADVILRSGDQRASSRLVRGLPFEGTGKGYEWAYREGHAYRLSAMAEDTASAGPPHRQGAGRVPA